MRNKQFKFKTISSIIINLIICINVIGQNKPARLIEKYKTKDNEIGISYEKYILNNGLQVVLHEDHSDPIVHVDVTYHVGSAREEIGRSGFAHFFEHMMFQGSDNVADEEHFKIITEAGGTLNGTTNTDRTNYFETLPSNYLETALWLESDRMGFLLDAVTQQKFEIQRSTVKNERGQRYDNAPYGLVFEKTLKNLFPYGHPYSWSTIGDIEDLNRVDVNDLKRFFLRWYGPNNATITIAGDINIENTLSLVNKYFGEIPAGPAVNNMPVNLAKLDKNRFISYEDNVKFPLIQVTFPSTQARSSDEAALDALAYVLAGNKSSFMYKNFIKTQKAISADVYNYGLELSGMFVVNIKANQDSKLADIYEMIKQTFKDFENKGVSEEDLNNFKAKTESDYINYLQTVSGKASLLASYNTFTGNPAYLNTEFKQYMSVTKEDVMRVYNLYVKDKNAVVLSCVPTGKTDLIAAADNFEYKKANPADANLKEYESLVYKKPKSSFDRSIKPLPEELPVLNVPQTYKQSLSNGIKILGTVSKEAPTTNIQINIPCGHRFEEKSKSGLSYLLASMLDESTKNFNAEDIDNQLDKLGSKIDIYPGNQEITINVFSLTKNTEKTIAILEDKMMNPKFDDVEFDRVKKEQLQKIINSSTQASTIANNIFNKLLYGDHIMSLPVSGTKESVESITKQDLVNFYNNYWSSNLASVIIVSDLPEKDIIGKLNFLNKIKNKNISWPVETNASGKCEKTTLYFVNKDNAAQSEIRIGYLSLPFDATDKYFKSTIMNYSLGGAFNSRININLREQKGYTYGARSSFNGSNYKGPFNAGAGVRTDATDSSVVEFFKEINKYRNEGITVQELEFTKSAIAQSEALKYESSYQKLGFLKRLIDYNLNSDFTKEQAKILKNITKNEIDSLAKEMLPLENMFIVVVGDKSKTFDALKKLGYKMVEMDINGNILN